MILADACVYAIVQGEELERVALAGSELTRTEKRRWKRAEHLLSKAQRDSVVLLVLLGEAAADRSQLLYWGALTEIDVSESATTYTADSLRPIPGQRTPQELVSLNTREPIAAGYIRSYVPCRVPQFLRDLATLEDEWFLLPDEEPTSQPLVEGRRMRVIVDAYERNREARLKCLEHHGCACVVCGFDFVARYGELGQGFIHVHHVTPLAAAKDEYVVDPIEDLRPVCPNCHAMLHRAQPPLTAPELRGRLG